MKKTEFHNRQYGFTLIETSIAVLIIGFILAALGFAFGAYVHNVKTQTTQERFEIVLNSLSSYVQRHNRLPCPAFPTPIADEPYGAEPGSGINGNEVGHCFTNTTLQTLYASNAGIIPWRTLGLQEELIFDGWGQYITYKPAPQLTLNTYAAEILDNTGGNDVLRACLNANWFNQAGEHIDRAKALFCCSAAPNPDYLTAQGETNTSLATAWKDNAITAAGVLDTSGLDASSAAPTNDDVSSSNAWIDDQNNNNFAGEFTVPNQDIDAALGRAQGHAITLISHGRDGYLAYLRGESNDERRNATITESNYSNQSPDIANDEAANAVSRIALAAVPNHPKTGDIGGVFDFLGQLSGASDDHIIYMTNEQLYSKAGFTASCQPPSGLYDQFDPCDSVQTSQRGDFAYLMDTSNSMNACAFGGTCTIAGEGSKIDIARSALANTYSQQLNLQGDLDEEDQYRLGAAGLNEFSNGCNLYEYDESDFFPTDNTPESAQEVIDRVNNLFARGRTPLIDRINSAINVVCFADGENVCDSDPTPQSASVLILTDGFDTCGGLVNELVDRKNADFPNLEVNFIHIFDENENATPLQTLADQLGGQYFAANSNEDIAQLLTDLSGGNACN